VEIRVGDLLLRRPRETDLAAVVTACSDSEIARFIPFIPVPYTEHAACSWLEHCDRAWASSEERTFAIADAHSDRLLGAVTVRLHEHGLVGFWLSRQARGNGVMTQAVKALVEWARTEHRIDRLSMIIHPENLASQRVAEKAGFVRIGVGSHEPPFRDGTSTVFRFELA
jgi:RimJ/RimL family protein N-acetyltransferase